MNAYKELIELLKARIIGNKVPNSRLNDLIAYLGKEIDRRKVYDEPSEETEALYEDALWLKSLSDE